MTSPGFDRVALFYDALAGMVFGKSMRESQFFYLDRIPSGAKVLILGGGTGWLAKRLLQINLTCNIVYQEASGEMISQSRMRMSESDLKRIRFVHSSEIVSGETFDVVITNFFLDLFQPSDLNDVVSQIKSSIDQNGLWIITEFVDQGKWWQFFLLKIMYMFFRIASGIQATSLPPWENTVHQNGMIPMESKGFYNGFIRSEVVKLS
jgi:tRNA (cmo5U34)-methyltransferase